MIDLFSIEERIREIAPKEAYGYRGYFLSSDYPLVIYDDGQIEFGGELDFSVGYLCYDVNRIVLEMLNAKGDNALFFEGGDSKNVFSKKGHYFCVCKDGTVVDGTPIYDFVGEKHCPLTVYELPDEISITPNQPISVCDYFGDKYLLAMKRASLVDDGHLEFKLLCKHIDSGVRCDHQFRVDLKRYLKCFVSNYDGFLASDASMDHLVGMEAVGIMGVERCYLSSEIDLGSEIFYNMERALFDNFDVIDAFIYKMSQVGCFCK